MHELFSKSKTLPQVINQFADKYDDFAVVAQPCISEGTAANLTPEVVSTVHRLKLASLLQYVF